MRDQDNFADERPMRVKKERRWTMAERQQGLQDQTKAVYLGRLVGQRDKKEWSETEQP
jgi:hypothetical protein